MSRRLRVLLGPVSEDPYFNLAVDESLTRLRLDDKINDTLRFWRVSPSVIVGYFQKITETVNLSYCDEHNISVLRRPSSGGAVYCDEGVLLFSLIINTHNWSVNTKYPMFSYKYLTRPIIDALKSVGVKATFLSPNIIIVNNKKIAGLAQFYLYNVLLLHGTLLINPNLNHLINSLRKPEVPFGDKLVSPFEGLISLCDVLPTFCKSGALKKFMWRVSSLFKKVFYKKIYFEPLTQREKTLAIKLRTLKYASEEWIANRPKITTLKIFPK